MKRYSFLLLSALILPACATSQEWGLGSVRWRDTNPKIAIQATPSEETDSALLGNAMESEEVQFSDVVEPETTNDTVSNANGYEDGE